MLHDLHDPANHAVWSQFDARYRPLVVAVARRLGLGDEEAADAAQETLAQFVKEYRNNKYDRQRGRLRAWLVAIARTRIAQQHRRRARHREWRGESAMVNLEDDNQLNDIWEQERRTVLLREAMTQLREHTKTSPKTIDAFERLMFHQQPVDVVAQALAMSAQDVYLAKSRIAQKLREILSRLEALYDAGG